MHRREVKLGSSPVGVRAASASNFGDLAVMVRGPSNADILSFVGFGIELRMLTFFCGFRYRIMNDLDSVCSFDGERRICGR